jgi:hypothetical protein
MPTVIETRRVGSEVTLQTGSPFPWGWLTLVAVVIGAALRIWQYAANPSLWVDEAAIARNVLERHASDLFGPLDYAQIAPPGFLLGVKLSVTLLGFSEYALRLVPFVAGIVSLPLFFVVARGVLRPVGTMVATLMFSIAVPLVVSASTLKQYSSDIAITLLVVAVSVRLLRSVLTLRSAGIFACVPAPLLFCSQAAVFPLSVACVVLFTNAFVTRRSDRWYRFVVVALWGIAVVSAVAYGSAAMTAVDNVYLHRFWEQAFMPGAGATTWLWTTAQSIFAGPPQPVTFDGSLHYSWPGLFAALVVVGGVTMCVKNAASGVLVVGPVVLALGASAAHAYPFGTRVSMFLLPLLLTAVVAGIEGVAQLLIRHRVSEYAPVLLLPLAILTFLKQPLPRRPEHLRPVMRYVSDHWKAGDALWVYYAAGQAFEYYSKKTPLNGDVRVGECDRTDPREYLRQVDAERGRARVWILMAHGSGPFGFDERQMLIAYLDSIGRRVDEFHAPPEDSTPNRAEVFLFDLSDTVRLGASSAERFAIQNKYPAQTWTCYGTMSPLGPKDRVVADVMSAAP